MSENRTGHQYTTGEGGTEEAGQQKPQQAAAGKGEQPGEGDAGSHTAVDRPPADGAGPENGGGLGVSGAHWKAGQRTQEQAKSAPQIGGQTLLGLSLIHI